MSKQAKSKKLTSKKQKKQIVFLEAYPTVMLYKISKIFREKGYETILIKLVEQNKEEKEFYNQAYDKIIDLNLIYQKVTTRNLHKILFSLIKKIKPLGKSFIEIIRLKPYAFFGRAPMSTPVAFFRILFRKTPFIYFPYDIRSQAIATYEEGKKYLPFFEIKADRYCFEHSDGIMHKGAPEELDYLNGRMLGNNIRLPKHQICFHPYCSKEFMVPINKNKLSKKDNETHMVYIGGILKPNYEYYMTQLNDFKEVLAQRVHVHFYFSSDVTEKKDLEEERKIKKSFIEKNKDFPSIKYFHIEDSFNPHEIVKEISKYDFGTFPCIDLSDNHGLAIKFLTGNKISSYFEAGIPFFYRKDHEFIDRLMKKYYLDFNWPEINNMKSIHKEIKKINQKQLEKNLEKARKDFSIETQFPRLERFVKQVVKDKKGKFF